MSPITFRHTRASSIVAFVLALLSGGVAIAAAPPVARALDPRSVIDGLAFDGQVQYLADTGRDRVVATLCPGESVSETNPVHLPPAPARADLLFAFDTTGSMTRVLSSAKDNAEAIMADLARLVPDIQFGVVDFRDYPLEPFGHLGDWPYLLRQSITLDRSAVVAAISATKAYRGGDGAEAYSRALYEAVADNAIGWRPDARRFVVMFGDNVPHDDDLNAGLAIQPVNPGGSWCGFLPSCLRDPGRDGVPGSSDDLDFQNVLTAFAASRATLLFFVSDSGGTNQAELEQYWRQWARWNGSSGDALYLSAASALPAAIVELVTGASRRISRLELQTYPPEYQDWLSSEPPAFTDIEVPVTGMDLSFKVRYKVPDGTVPGTYRFEVKAVGDGAVYAEQGVVISIPTYCATPIPKASRTPIPRPRPVYLPLLLREAPLKHNQPLDIVLVLDTSSSMAGAKLDAAKAAVWYFLDGVDLRTARVALVGFDGTARTYLPLMSDALRLKVGAAGLLSGQGTRIDLGLAEARAVLEERTGDEARRDAAVILLTDGRHTGPPEAPDAEARALRAAGVRLQFVGLGADVDPAALRRWAGAPAAVHLAPGPEDLEDLYGRLARVLTCLPGDYWGRRCGGP